LDAGLRNLVAEIARMRLVCAFYTLSQGCSSQESGFGLWKTELRAFEIGQGISGLSFPMLPPLDFARNRSAGGPSGAKAGGEYHSTLLPGCIQDSVLLPRLCLLAAKSTRWNPRVCFAGSAFCRIDSTSCASMPRATQMHKLIRVSIFSSPLSDSLKLSQPI